MHTEIVLPKKGNANCVRFLACTFLKTVMFLLKNNLILLVYLHPLLSTPNPLTLTDFWYIKSGRSIRIFEGVRDKSANDAQYLEIVASLKPIIAELQLSTPAELGFQKA